MRWGLGRALVVQLPADDAGEKLWSLVGIVSWGIGKLEDFDFMFNAIMVH